jgi:photosystem II stability/assembly factor-like uncharacterized protein
MKVFFLPAIYACSSIFNRRSIILYAFLLLLFTSCGKDSISISSFREITVPSRDDLSSIAFSDSLNGSLTGGKAWELGFIMNTRDGGFSWETDTTTDRKMEHVCFDPSGQGYACGQDLLLYRLPGGVHWQVFRIDYQWLRSCHFPDGKRGAVVGGEGYHGGRVQTFGPEAFWKTDTVQTFPNEIESVWYSDSNTLHAVGFGWIMRSADAGHSWERFDITGDFFQSVHFPNPNTGYICGSSGTILKTIDGGLHWQNLRKGGSTGNRQKAFHAIWFATAEKGWVVGDGGIFWQTEDGGVSWNPVAEAPSDVDYTHVCVFGKTGWATAKAGRLFRFEL